MFIVTNQASKTESLTIHPSGNPGLPLASTGPINPQATAQVTVDLHGPRNYTISASKAGATEAARGDRDCDRAGEAARRQASPERKQRAAAALAKRAT